MKVQIVKRFNDKNAVKLGMSKIVEISKPDEIVEYPEGNADELIESGKCS